MSRAGSSTWAAVMSAIHKDENPSIKKSVSNFKSLSIPSNVTFPADHSSFSINCRKGLGGTEVCKLGSGNSNMSKPTYVSIGIQASTKKKRKLAKKARKTVKKTTKKTTKKTSTTKTPVKIVVKTTTSKPRSISGWTSKEIKKGRFTQACKALCWGKTIPKAVVK